MRKRRGTKAAALVLSLCMAFTSALSVGAGSFTAYAAEQKTVEEENPAESGGGMGDLGIENNSEDPTSSKDEESSNVGGTSKSEENSSGSGTSKSEENLNSDGTAAKLAESSEKAAETNHAILVHLAAGYSLDAVPQQDAESMRTLLYNTDQFDESQNSIELYAIPEGSKTDYKTALWEKIDAIAEETDEKSFTVFFYSGHGGALADGTSSLALTGVNDISAAELRQHLNALSGRVMVILSCCHSGGMIMPATGLDEMGDAGSGSEGDTYDADKFLEEFNQAGEISLASESEDASIDDTESGDDSAVSEENASATKEPPQYYFIAAANRVETSIQLQGIGGEDNAALGHALGFDRNNASYHVFAADTTTREGATNRKGYEGDGQITMKELADFYQKYTRLTSSPVLYPAESEDVLFTYGESNGTPASFTCSIPQENVTVDEKGNISITAKITNLTDHTITVGAGVYDWSMLSCALTTASRGKDSEGNVMKPEDGYIPATNEKGYYDEYTVQPNTTDGEITYHFTWDEFLDGVSNKAQNPFCLKIWDCTDDAEDADGYGPIGTYRLMSFYTAAAGEKASSIDPKALRLNKPIQLTADSAEDTYTVTKTSSQLPMEIVFDSETESKLTNAACTLSLYASDLGEVLPDGIHVAKLTNKKDEETYVLKNKKNSVISPQAKDWNVVFENVQPSYERNGGNNERGSVYTYIMDTTKLTKGHYYALQVICHDNSTGKDKSIFALIQRTDAASAEQYQIPEFRISMDHWGYFRAWDGIMADASWDELKDLFDEKFYYAEGVSEILQKTLQLQDGGAQFTYAVGNWKRLASAKSEKWVAMGKTERFSPGGTYQCDIVVTINDGSDAIFTDDTVFTTDRHDLKLNLEEGGKKATLTVTHRIPTQSSFDSTTVQLRRITVNGDSSVIGEEVAQQDETLHPGDTVIMIPGKDCTATVRGGLTEAGKNVLWNGTWYKVYKVSDIKKGETSLAIQLSVWKDEDEAVNCSCAPVLRSWVAHPKVDGGDDGSSDTDKKGDSSGSQSDGGSSGGDSGSSTVAADQSKSSWQSIPGKAVQSQVAPVMTADAAEQNSPVAAPAQTGSDASGVQSSSASAGIAKKAGKGADEGTSKETVTDADAAEETQDEGNTEEILPSGDAADEEIAAVQKTEGNHAGESATVKSALDPALVKWLLVILAAAVGASIFIILLYKRRKDEEEPSER